MPEMNGLEAAAAIRKLEEGGEERMPIIAVTGFAADEDRAKCLVHMVRPISHRPLRLTHLYSPTLPLCPHPPGRLHDQAHKSRGAGG